MILERDGWHALTREEAARALRTVRRPTPERRAVVAIAMALAVVVAALAVVAAMVVLVTT